MNKLVPFFENEPRVSNGAAGTSALSSSSPNNSTKCLASGPVADVVILSPSSDGSRPVVPSNVPRILSTLNVTLDNASAPPDSTILPSSSNGTAGSATSSQGSIIACMSVTLRLIEASMS